MNSRGIPNYLAITENPDDVISDVISKGGYSQIAVLVDDNTRKHCYPELQNLAEHTLIEVSSGEKNKTLDTCQHIWANLTDAGFDRRGLLINLGGGVIGDMGGFAASCYKRGIDFVNIPTTLLAQVDASIGGKLGVDFQGLKNHIGVFQLPRKVIVSPQFLSTLPSRELRSGFAEVVKHGLIYDAKHFESLKSPDEYNPQQLSELIAHSISIKNEVVSADPKEHGLRKILNFGHTIGHAIESMYLETDTSLLHGEAVAIGMVCEAYLSTLYLGLNKGEQEQIVKKIFDVFPKVDLRINEAKFLEKLNQDKKNKGKEIQGALLKSIGNAEYNVTIKGRDAMGAIAFYTSC